MNKIFYLALVLSCVFIAGCSPATQSSTTSSMPTTFSGPTASIKIASFAFDPNSLPIASGTTVIWTNNDPTVHNIVSLSGPASFNSGNLNAGSTFSFQFTTIGTYEYECSIHPTMRGTITVQ